MVGAEPPRGSKLQPGLRGNLQIGALLRISTGMKAFDQGEFHGLGILVHALVGKLIFPLFFSGHVTSHALPSYLNPGLPWQSFTRQSDQWSPARCLPGIVTRLRNFFSRKRPCFGTKIFGKTFSLLKH